MAETISTTAIVPATVAPGAQVSYVDWPAIFGGAAIAAAIAFVLTAFGTALGLSMVSPYRGEGASGVWVAVATGLWILWVTVTSFMAGGYIAGRLRRRIGDASEHEVDVRDGSHGLIVWAVATLIGVGMLAAGIYGTGSIAARGATAAATTAVTVAAAATGARAGQVDGPYSLIVDQMFGASDEAAKPGAENARSITARVITNGVAARSLADTDRTYLAKLVAARTGVDEPAAQARVDQAYKQAEEVAAKAKEAANAARKFGIVAAFLLAVSLLIGGAAAWWAAGLGGRHRDAQTAFAWLRWR